MRKIRILGLGGSIRAHPAGARFLIDFVLKSENLTEFSSLVDAHNERNLKEKRKYTLTNTDVCAGAGLLAAKNQGAEIDYFPLCALFPKHEKPVLHPSHRSAVGLRNDIPYYDFLDIDETLKALLIEKIRWADAVLLASPVYFGDRSSVANKSIQIALQEGVFEKKIIGAVSAGAKRNGGQETTNVFYLSEALAMGSYVVGNGPKTSQYGGTAIAGDLGTVTSDRIGLETCYGVGTRLSQCAELFALRPPKKKRLRKLTVLVTMDTPQRQLHQVLVERFRKLQKEFPKISVELVQLIEGEVDRCLACNICPIPELVEKQDYGCIIGTQRDMMKSIREVLMASDGIVIAGLNLKQMKDVIYRYQVVTERTRFIRRNDFELTNVPITSFTLNEVGATGNSVFWLKVMSSYLRHNTILLPPISEHISKGNVLESSESGIREFLQRLEFVGERRDVSSGVKVRYQAGKEGGYSDDTLDHTTALRF